MPYEIVVIPDHAASNQGGWKYHIWATNTGGGRIKLIGACLTPEDARAIVDVLSGPRHVLLGTLTLGETFVHEKITFIIAQHQTPDSPQKRVIVLATGREMTLAESTIVEKVKVEFKVVK